MARLNERITTSVTLEGFQAINHFDGSMEVRADGWFNLRNILWGMKNELDEAIKLVEAKREAETQ